MSGWIGVDFDGTLAEYGKWQGPDHCGAPVPAMVERVKRWLAAGHEVRIFTARVWPTPGVILPSHNVAARASAEREAAKLDPSHTRYAEASEAAVAIQAWCQEHLGQVLPITCLKDFSMVELYDDRAVQVEMNTGRLVGQSTRGLA